MVLRIDMANGHIRPHFRSIEQTRKVKTLGLPVLNPFAHVEQVGSTHQIIELAYAQLRHDLTHFFSNEEEIVDHVLRLTRELFAQCGILCGNAHRTSVEVTLAHHDATLDHQRCSCKTKFIGPQQCTHHHVATCLHLTVGLHTDSTAQAIQHQCLLGFGQTDFPRTAGMLDRRQR